MSNKTLKTAIFSYIQQCYGQNNPTFSSKELLKSLSRTGINVPERTLRRWLVKWHTDGLILKKGQKRGTRYQLAQTLAGAKNTEPPSFLQHINPAKQQVVLAQLRDLWTHSSTAIEGNTLTLGDTHAILEMGLTISGKLLREHHEVIGHAKAIDLIYQISREPLTKQHLFDLHKAVQKEVVVDTYQPVGQWKVEKNYSNSITSNDEPVLIEYAAPQEVDALMINLIDQINQLDNNNLNPKNAPQNYAKIHLGFVHIHPFADGNGRLARLIANIPLIKAGLPPLLIDQNRRREYITLLADYQNKLGTPSIQSVRVNGFWPEPELLEPFCRFCEENYQSTIDFIGYGS